MEDFMKRNTSDNRLLVVVMSNAARLATSIGPGAINPQYWSAILLAMLNACHEALGQVEELREVIAAQEDEIDALTAANKSQAARIEALLDTIRTQDRKIAECLMSQSPSTPISVWTESCAPAAPNTSNGNGPMPQPASTPASTRNGDIATSASPASGATPKGPKGRRYGYPPDQLEQVVIARIRQLMTERGMKTLATREWDETVHDLPKISGLTKMLRTKWSDLLVAAGGLPLKAGQKPENLPENLVQIEQCAPVAPEEVTPALAVRFPARHEAGA